VRRGPDSPPVWAEGILAAMSPVKPTKARNPRAMALAVGGVVLGLVLVLLLFVLAIPSLTESGKVQVKLGVDTFNAGSAESRARNIAKDGPFLLGDVAGRQRDIYLQHLGDDPATGWSAFDARQVGQTRDCTLQWQSDSQEFRNPCDGSTVPADGTGLIAYTVKVTDDGNVVVDLSTNDPTTTTSTAAVTTSTITVTSRG